jgi:hypothetical protein
MGSSQAALNRPCDGASDIRLSVAASLMSGAHGLNRNRKFTRHVVLLPVVHVRFSSATNVLQKGTVTFLGTQQYDRMTIAAQHPDLVVANVGQQGRIKSGALCKQLGFA